MSSEQAESHHGAGNISSSLTSYLIAQTGQVNHQSKLLKCLKNRLFSNPEYADVHLVVEGVRFPAHTMILAARSDYFHALFFGGMKETGEAEVELKGVSMATLKVLLEYVYSGHLSLCEIKEDVILDLLCLCNEYQGGFEELEASICKHLEAILNAGNVCAILDTALMLGKNSLITAACLFGDANAKSLLEHSSFFNLSPAGVTKLLSRDTLCAEEEYVLDRALAWIGHNEDHPNAAKVFKNVRLHLLEIDTLIGTVKPTGLVHFDDIFDAIVAQGEAGWELQYRTRLVVEENVADIAHGASCELGDAILYGNSNDNALKCLTGQTLGENEGIVIQLGQLYILNHIRMLQSKMSTSSFRIQVSVDKVNWVRITDYREYHCSSYQYIFFPQRAVRFIKIVGNGDLLNLVKVEALYTTKEFLICPKFGILCDKENVATVDEGGPVIKGAHVNVLFDGKETLRQGRYRYYFTDGDISLTTSQPKILESVSMLCFGGNCIHKIEVSRDKSSWETVYDMPQAIFKSFQTITISPIPVVYIRIVGKLEWTNRTFHYFIDTS